MTKRYFLIVICLMFAALACLPSSGVQLPATLPPTAAATATAQPALTPTTGLVTPTAAAPVSTPPPVFPLPADLLYLNDTGQVWLQPNTGDETKAVQISGKADVVTDFAVAPGGQWLLYRVGGAVSVIALDGSGGQVIAPQAGPPPDAAQGHTLAWSPDAARIAYTTAAGFEIDIPGGGSNGPLIFAVPVTDSPVIDLSWSPSSRWLLARRADGDTLLADTNDPKTLRLSDLGKVNGAAFLADDQILFAPAEGGLAVVPPDQLDTRTFLIKQDRQVDLPVGRPDGTAAFFVHSGGLSQPGALYTGKVADQSFQQAGGAAIATQGLVWSLDASTLLGRGDGSFLRIVDPVGGAESQLKTQGSPASFAWGQAPLRGVDSLPLPKTLYFLAPQSGVVQVWRLPGNASPPEPITNASYDVTAYDISVDGTQVVFTSNGNLYRSTIGTSDIQEIAVLAKGAHSPTGTPAFSPTGRRIAFASNGLYIYDTGLKDSVRLLLDIAPPNYPAEKTQIFDQPRWSPDGLWMLLRVTYFQGQDQALVPTGGGFDPAPFHDFSAQAKWGSDGAIYVFSDGTTFGQPTLSRLTPARPPIVTKLLDAPVIDARLRPDGRLAILRSPSPFPFGPTSTRIYSIAPDGSDLRAETPSLVLEQPLLSPDAVLVAGLAMTQKDAAGNVTGELVIVNPATHDTFVLNGISGVHSLMWGK